MTEDAVSELAKGPPLERVDDAAFVTVENSVPAVPDGSTPAAEESVLLAPNNPLVIEGSPVETGKEPGLVVVGK